MAAKPEAAAIADRYIEASPFPHERILAVRANDPAAPHRAQVNLCTPAQSNTDSFGLFDHHSM
jgi:hypothetical protein